MAVSYTHLDVYKRQLLKGDAFIESGSRIILLDADAIQTLQSVFSDCATGEGRQPGSFRLAPVYAAYAANALQALDGVDIEAPPEWMAAAAQSNRLTAPAEDPLDPVSYTHLE